MTCAFGGLQYGDYNINYTWGPWWESNHQCAGGIGWTYHSPLGIIQNAGQTVYHIQANPGGVTYRWAG